MSPMDWNRLAPHRPLEAGDALRVERPSSNGERLAALVKARMGPIAVVGPVGCGKSTELAAAAKALEGHVVTVLVPLDRLMDMRQVDESMMFHIIGHQLFQSLAPPLRSGLSENAQNLSVPFESSSYRSLGRDPLLSLLREINRKSAQPRVALLLDGLEKCPKEMARAAIRALLSLRDETELAVVVPLELVTGPEGYEFLTELRAFPIRPVPVFREQADWQEGRAFLKQIFCRRMELPGVPDSLETSLEAAALASNGLPRTFLQILRSAGGYATIAGRELFNFEDLRTAVLDQKESLQRILRDGDMPVLLDVHGKEGMEIPLERRIRLLTHGLLLEYEENGRIVVRMNELLQPQ